ncbi:MAG: amidase family protein, partial [Mycobacterium sp.]
GWDPQSLESADSAVAQVVYDALGTLAGLGAGSHEVVLPPTVSLASSWGTYVGAEAAVVHERTFPSQSAAYGTFVRQLLDAGHAVSGMDVARIERERRLFAGKLAAIFEDVDLLIIPVLSLADLTLDRIARLLTDPEELPNLLGFLAPFNFSGNPTITLPGGFDQSGVPIGFQLVARHFDEPLLVRAGRAFQTASDWHLRRPPLGV